MAYYELILIEPSPSAWQEYRLLHGAAPYGGHGWSGMMYSELSLKWREAAYAHLRDLGHSSGALVDTLHVGA